MGRFHDVVLAKYVAYLRSRGEIVQTEVRLRMADGSAGTRLDILAWDPHANIIYGVEVKTGGNPPFTKGQFVVYPHLMLGGTVVSLDGKVMAMGLIPNVPLPPIPVFKYYQRDENSNYEIERLNPENMSQYFRQRK